MITNRYECILSIIMQAGDRLLAARDHHVSISTKNNDPRDLVTNVDIEINDFIKSEISTYFPGDKIYSEETGGDITAGSFWTIDPIDGTSNFSKRIPHFAVVISFVENGDIACGAIFNPVTKELFSFNKEGAYLNGEPIKVTTVTNLSEAGVMLSIGRKEVTREWGINLHRHFLGNAHKIINLSSSALDLAFLASGRVDVVIYGTMTTADIAAAIALVRRAGGEVYDISGTPVKLSTEPQQIIATSTRALFDAIPTY